jgi:hypothetical protein
MPTFDEFFLAESDFNDDSVNIMETENKKRLESLQTFVFDVFVACNRNYYNFVPIDDANDVNTKADSKAEIGLIDESGAEYKYSFGFYPSPLSKDRSILVSEIKELYLEMKEKYGDDFWIERSTGKIFGVYDGNAYSKMEHVFLKKVNLDWVKKKK